MLEERWAMARWLTTYIDKNQEMWNQESIENQKTEDQKAAEWHKMKRLDKIRVIKEKLQENKRVTLIMKPLKLTLNSKTAAQHPDEEENHQEGQAEQPSRPGEVPPGQEQEQQNGPGEQGADAQADAKHGADDQLGHHVAEQPSQQISSSSSSYPPPNTVQSPTIPGAVLRCVTVHDFNTHILLLTPNKPGTLPVETSQQRGSQARPQCTTPTGTGQAEQPGGQAEMQLPLDQPQQAAKDGDQAGGVGEPEVHPDAQDELGGRADEPDDQSRPGAVLQKSVQSPTIPGVVLRCVSVQENIICTQLITSPKLGTSPLWIHSKFREFTVF